MANRARPAGAANITNDVLASFFNVANGDGGVAPMFPSKFSTNIDNLRTGWGVDLTVTGVVKAAIIAAVHASTLTNIPREGARDSAITMTTSQAAGHDPVVGSSAAVADIENNENGNFLKKVINSVPSARTWIMDLSAAQQTKNLNVKNIESYFQSKDGTDVNGRSILDIVIPIARALPKILNDPGARAAIFHNANDWIKYHTTATSTSGIMHKWVPIINNAFPNTFGDTTIAAVNAAAANAHDKALADAIPSMAVAVVYLWLKASKMLPTDWFQGTKAISGMNPAISRQFTKLFNKYLSLAAEDDTADACANIIALTEYHARTNALRGF